VTIKGYAVTAFKVFEKSLLVPQAKTDLKFFMHKRTLLAPGNESLFSSPF